MVFSPMSSFLTAVGAFLLPPVTFPTMYQQPDAENFVYVSGEVEQHTFNEDHVEGEFFDTDALI